MRKPKTDRSAVASRCSQARNDNELGVTGAINRADPGHQSYSVYDCINHDPAKALPLSRRLADKLSRLISSIRPVCISIISGGVLCRCLHLSFSLSLSVIWMCFDTPVRLIEIYDFELAPDARREKGGEE